MKKYQFFINNKPKSNKGLSLIETVIYVSILAVIFVLVVNTVIVVSNSFGKVRLKRNIITQGSGAMERMLREIRMANSIDITDSVFGVNPGRIKLNTIESSTNNTAVTREFFLNNEALEIQQGISTPNKLTSGVVIDSLVFYMVSAGDTSEAIRMKMTVTDSFGKFTESETLYGTAVLRRSY